MIEKDQDCDEQLVNNIRSGVPVNSLLFLGHDQQVDDDEMSSLLSGSDEVVDSVALVAGSNNSSSCKQKEKEKQEQEMSEEENKTNKKNRKQKSYTNLHHVGNMLTNREQRATARAPATPHLGIMNKQK